MDAVEIGTSFRANARQDSGADGPLAMQVATVEIGCYDSAWRLQGFYARTPLGRRNRLEHEARGLRPIPRMELTAGHQGARPRQALPMIYAGRHAYARAEI